MVLPSNQWNSVDPWICAARRDLRDLFLLLNILNDVWLYNSVVLVEINFEYINPLIIFSTDLITIKDSTVILESKDEIYVEIIQIKS